MAKSKNQNKQQNPVVSMEDFEKMMAEVEALKAKNAKVQAENDKLKDRLQQRPEGALWLPNGTIYFPKGSRKDLIGKTIKCAVPAEALGKMYLLGEVKESKNGNGYCKLQGWIDTRKLNLPAEGEASNDSAAEKATRSMKDLVG